ncbi:MAG: hypothetical protein ACI4MJ_04820 [Aristaeellaceae bacterium]
MFLLAPIRRLFSVCLVLFLASSGSAFAEQTLRIHQQPFSDWCVVCELTVPQGFAGQLMQYRYRQRGFDDIAAQVSGGIQAAFDGSSPQLLPPGTMSLLLPTCPLGARQDAAHCMLCRNQLRQALQTAGFRPAEAPFLCATLAELETCHRQNTIGRLNTPEQWLACCNTGIPLSLTDALLLWVPEADGYPIVPMLFSDASEQDVPMYAAMVLRDDEPLCLEVGGTCELIDSVPLGEAVIPWDDAVERALDYALGLYQPAMASMARVREAGFDYSSFWQAHTPTFILRAESVQTAYYARRNLLQPCWYVGLSLTVQLTGTDALTPQNWHSYLPEVLQIACCVDAITGEIVR